MNNDGEVVKAIECDHCAELIPINAKKAVFVDVINRTLHFNYTDGSSADAAERRVYHGRCYESLLSGHLDGV